MIPFLRRQLRSLASRDEQAEMALMALQNAGYQVIELRPELTLSRKWETTLRVGHRDVLTTFGWNRLEALQRAIGAVEA